MYVIRSGVKGQKWGHRYHQSYDVKPTRSGMIGEEHGDAAKERSSKNNYSESKEYKKAAELYKKSRLSETDEKHDLYNKKLDEYLNSKEYRKFYDGLSENEKKSLNNSLTNLSDTNSKYMDSKTIKQINKESQKHPEDFSRREAGLMDERVIPAGTKIYRTTVDKEEGVDGPKYVSYMDVDRNLYKGGWVRETGKSKASYENTYELKEDLRIPSNETVNKAIKDTILKDKSLTKEALESWDQMFNGRGGRKTIKQNFEIVKKNMTEGKMSLDQAEKRLKDIQSFYKDIGVKESKYYNMTPKEYLKEVNDIRKDNKKQIKENFGTTNYDTYMNKKAKELRDQPIEEATFKVAQTYGINTKAKEKVIAELKKQGYNAMPDYASIGGVGKFSKEGVDPLIIFDGSNSLDKKKVSGITGTKGTTAKKVAMTVGFSLGLTAATMGFGSLILNPISISSGFDKESNSQAKYNMWSRRANSKDSVWRGSFIELNDLLRVNMRNVDVSIDDLLRSGVI